MSNLTEAAKKLFQEKGIELVIGYVKGRPDRAKAAFFTNADINQELIFDQSCTQNLITYIQKPEVKKYGKTAVVVTDAAIRAYLQLAAENQIKHEKYVLLKQEPDGTVLLFENYKDIEEYIKDKPGILPPYAKEKLDQIRNLENKDRWNFWVQEFSSCIKCYACRAACPMCYCSKCTVESNQPQWIPPQASTQGNLEWHLLRAMHMAGRCISCGECTKACPVDIPVGLLSAHLNDELYNMFGSRPGMKHDDEYALSVYNPNDKEEFIR